MKPLLLLIAGATQNELARQVRYLKVENEILRSTKFTPSFDEVFKKSGGEAKETAFRSPNTNAYVERLIQALQQEVLDHFVVFGERHMDLLVSEMVEHYHEERPHQGMDNDLLVARKGD